MSVLKCAATACHVKPMRSCWHGALIQPCVKWRSSSAVRNAIALAVAIIKSSGGRPPGSVVGSCSVGSSQSSTDASLRGCDWTESDFLRVGRRGDGADRRSTIAAERGRNTKVRAGAFGQQTATKKRAQKP